MWSNNKLSSYLDLILGPMFSGKTSKLIEIYEYCIKSGFNVIAINHKLDTRYGVNIIASHDNKSIPCIQVEKLYDIYNNPQYSKLLSEADVILINEGQFFEDLFKFVLHNLEEKTKQIHICGLDGDFQRNKFGQLLDLIPYCDDVKKLKGMCKKCPQDRESLFTFRITNENEQTCIGIDNYTSLCRLCYNNMTKG